VSNAGGVNPPGCAAAPQAVCDPLGLSLKIATVTMRRAGGGDFTPVGRRSRLGEHRNTPWPSALPSVFEQRRYEIVHAAPYILPDCVADFSRVTLTAVGIDACWPRGLAAGRGLD
jgi:hypothetical protein